jgi:hypothetical protein
MANDYLPFADIVKELRQLCDRRASGTLFISTEANRSAQVMIDRGEIIFVYFYNKRGEDALKLMASVEAGRFRFQEGVLSTRRMALPTTDVILDMLANYDRPADVSAKKAKVQVEKLTEEQKAVLKDCLTEYIGPMAAIICDDHFGHVAGLQAAVEALAQEIPSPEQAEGFKKKVTDRLGQ